MVSRGRTARKCNSQFNLGVMYANGRGVYQSHATAAEWYRKAADQGDAAAQYNLGIMYEKGEGVDQSHATAVKWYRKAADQGDAVAQYNLESMYENSRCVDQNNILAVKWFWKAIADQGNAVEQYNLGAMYANGNGVDQSDSMAVKWYRKAAEQGYANAQCNLGSMYENGEGVDQNDDLAVKWFCKAAKQGHVEAQINLIYLYEKVKDFNLAYEWVLKAIENENSDESIKKKAVMKKIDLGKKIENKRWKEHKDKYVDCKKVSSLKDCAFCGAPGSFTPKGIIHKRCSKCKITWYCSVKCQKEDWRYHKKHCLAPEQRRVPKELKK